MSTPTTKDYVNSLYVSMYDRAPDLAGQTYWLNFAAQTGKTGLSLMYAMSAEFSLNEAFNQIYGGLGNAAFVNTLYENIGGNQGDPSGVAYWNSRLATLSSQDPLTARSKLIAEFTYNLIIFNRDDPSWDSLTPEQYLAACHNQDQLLNKMAVGQAFVDYMGSATNPTTVPVMHDPAYVAAQSIIAGVTWDPASMAEELAYLQSSSASIEGINELFAPNGAGDTYVLKVGQDLITGTPSDDLFLATNLSLETGDALNGAGGFDTLKLSASGDNLSSPTLTSIEKIWVNAPNVLNPVIEIDLSNADRSLEQIESFQVSDYASTGGYVAFYDIQKVEGLHISITDTRVDHEFTFDTNAYDATKDDVVGLTLKEVRGASVIFGNDAPYAPGESNLNGINLVSAINSLHQVTPSNSNLLDGLYVGDDFHDLTISGDADLEIVDSLDRNVRVINAAALAADLTLTVDREPTVAAFTLQYIGAQGDDDFWLERTGDSNIDLGTGDDLLHVFPYYDPEIGNMTIAAGAGNDTVEIYGDGRNIIDLGADDDELLIVGNVENYATGTEGDGVSTIDAGAGDDDVTIVGDGDYLVDLGTGNDAFTKVGNSSHTIYGGSGNDTVTVDGGTGETINRVYLGEGDDELSITGGYGNQTIDGGDGNDAAVVSVDESDVVATMGKGNDSLTIEANEEYRNVGVHNVDLGEGDDYLLIDGSRLPLDNIDNTTSDRQTTIIGGAGNDTVDVRYDHYLKADLGTGNDLMILNAQDITTDDSVAAGAGTDTLTITAFPDPEPSAQLRASETRQITGFEVFDLHDSNIVLELTDTMFQTAEGNSVTVKTLNSNGIDLPSLGLRGSSAEVMPFMSGMSHAAWMVIVTDWRNGVYDYQTKAHYDALGLSEAGKLAEAEDDLVAWLEGPGGLE